MGSTTEADFKQKLIWNVKREVKQLMEEAVTKKFVHEDSSHIIALCSTVEACLLHMLKRRAAGFLRSDKIAALFTKIGKVSSTAGEVCRKVTELQQQHAEGGRRAQCSGQESLKRQGSTAGRAPQSLTPQALKHIWVRTALFDKVLDKIVQYVVDNSSKYYEKEALMHDAVYGPILAALLVGPCALEYSKLKTSDHFWTDPSANELVQRHRIHGAHGRQDSSPSKRPALGIRKRQSSGSMSEDRLAASARDYVESLHQNSRTHLLYGKNNVLVQPKEHMEALRGYLSLHQAAGHLTLKWTPNQLMNGTLGDCDLEKSIYWDYALTVPLSQIVCIHCHQRPDCGGTLVLVSQDGIQRPPLHFPEGGHLLAFLSCLENGLLPRGQLEPPLWTQRGKGKVFPKLRRRNSTIKLGETREEEIATDYVFRIVSAGHRHDSITINYHHMAGSRVPSVDEDEEEEDRLHAMISMICSRNLTAPNMMKDPNEMIEMQGFGSSPLSWQQGESNSRVSSCLSCSTGSSNTPHDLPIGSTCIHDRIPLKMLCQNMKRQIVSRAFYGWLAYCRHLSTVRTHLSALVNRSIVPPGEPCEASGGLSKEVWSKYQKDCKNYKELELLRLVYYGGVEHEIRKEVWPFLLGHYRFGMTKKEMGQIDEKMAVKYQKVMWEWKACEVIVKQREKESHSTAFSKFSSGSSIDSHVLRLVHRDSTISNEVFMSVDELEAARRDRGQDDGASTLLHARTPGADEGPSVEFESPDSGLPSSRNYSVTSGHSQVTSSIEDEAGPETGDEAQEHRAREMLRKEGAQDSISEEQLCSQLDMLMGGEGGSLPSFTSYTIELLDTVALNLHRIDKDVQRCDRNYWYFTADNLEKLRSIICSYVWEHLEVGYVQGMCDLLAPLMVVLDNESLAYSCFTQLMKRMSQNFPNGGAMDTHFANMRSLIQILDSELFELMHQNGDYTHFYFCYRWFLLDFKRELLYEDVFAVWEVIWVAKHISSEHFVLFIALALVEVYREIIRDNNMDFTDIIKFFNEMAERHDVQQILRLARELVYKVQTLIENK
ncbi:small G protein signaling modulator 2 isoform X2 [Polyodon spathula]|uniref:small G protein signaling modulator 2 isoform X2 n=1 Tax=Polyodon spathula TaxID=7913 RepID=UPI001B7DE3FE|nr:small G protein signaling modulator 2 isoform X2 [Polyodon spathula]